MVNLLFQKIGRAFAPQGLEAESLSSSYYPLIHLLGQQSKQKVGTRTSQGRVPLRCSYHAPKSRGLFLANVA